MVVLCAANVDAMLYMRALWLICHELLCDSLSSLDFSSNRDPISISTHSRLKAIKSLTSLHFLEFLASICLTPFAGLSDAPPNLCQGVSFGPQDSHELIPARRYAPEAKGIGLLWRGHDFFSSLD